ncbi:MAG: hypothetical protein WBB67_11855 [bacterium]
MFDILSIITKLIIGISWPVAVIVILLVFRTEIRSFLNEVILIHIAKHGTIVRQPKESKPMLNKKKFKKREKYK